ncbi:HupE/UreJ family protein [Labrenzia sp. PHM005]|nr:HupE/UreJ family protein [Labrenzia sp. PHM005]
MKRFFFGLLILLSGSIGAPQVHGHALQPGYLELQYVDGDQWRVLWRKPGVRGHPMAIGTDLPENCDRRSAPDPAFDGTAWVVQWVTVCPGGLAGGTIAIPGLDATQTDVLVRFELASDKSATQRLTPGLPSFVIPADPGFFEILRSYFALGVDHILEGLDHLLFVFALLLLIREKWKLVGAVTAFTIAHSITMAISTLGVFTLPGPPVEAVIALSIMFLASELLQRNNDEDRLTEKFPWIVSFSFGLLHGFGFAGALAEIGLPDDDVPLALLSFNLGVEAGQLLFIACILVTAALLKMFMPALIRAMRTPGHIGSTSVAYGIGSLSAFWFVERIAGF